MLMLTLKMKISNLKEVKKSMEFTRSLRSNPIIGNLETKLKDKKKKREMKIVVLNVLYEDK
jgi:hypothetical protein